MKITDWFKKKKERRRRNELEKEWKPLRRQYAGMIFAALLSKERGFSRYQDAPTTESNKFLGNITMSLRSFIQDVHGTKKPNSLQEKQVIGLLRALQDTFISITQIDGKSITTPLCHFSFSKDGDRAPQMLHLTLPSIWSETLKGLGSVPQDIAYRLTDTLGRRKTPTHIKLVNLLSVQDVRKPFKRNIENLVKELNLTKYYQSNKKKVEILIINVCNDLTELNLINSFVTKVTKTRGKDRLIGIEICLKGKE